MISPSLKHVFRAAVVAIPAVLVFIAVGCGDSNTLDGSCGPACAGCCLLGECIPPSLMSQSSCGAGGSACAPCQGNLTCDMENGQGCVDPTAKLTQGTGVCAAGLAPWSPACGGCADPDTGCCLPTGSAHQTQQKCGKAGDCEPCGSKQQCVNGVCQDAPQTVSDCDPRFECFDGASAECLSMTRKRCGGGGACMTCPDDLICVSGSCQKPSNTCEATCEGCCQGSVCKRYEDQTNNMCSTPQGMQCASCSGRSALQGYVCSKTSAGCLKQSQVGGNARVCIGSATIPGDKGCKNIRVQISAGGAQPKITPARDGVILSDGGSEKRCQVYFPTDSCLTGLREQEVYGTDIVLEIRAGGNSWFSWYSGKVVDECLVSVSAVDFRGHLGQTAKTVDCRSQSRVSVKFYTTGITYY